MSDIRAMISDEQDTTTAIHTVVSGQSAKNNSETEVTALLNDVKSFLCENKMPKDTFNGEMSGARARVQGERTFVSTQQRDARVTLASDQSSVNALASIERTSTEGVIDEAAHGSAKLGRAQIQREGVQSEEQCNNNAGQIQRGIDDLLNNDSLKNDSDLVNLAAKRLAELGLQVTQDSDVLQSKSGYAGKGKKSGAVSKATDKVVKESDWPYYHITRGVDLMPSSYDELSLDEFCLGYIRMLRDADSKFNLHIMLEVLEDMLEDTVDFSWKNVKG